MASRRLPDSNRDQAGSFIGEIAVTQSCAPCMRTNIAKTATVFCKDCDEYLCDACKLPHTVYKPGKHDIVNIQVNKSAPSISDMKGMEKCHEHDKEIEFFCKDHSKLCCSSCLLIHRKCNQVDEIARQKQPKTAETSPKNLSSQSRPVTLELLVSVDLPDTGYELSGLDFLPDGRIVAVDTYNEKCIILNERLQILGTPYKFKHPPQYVVCVSQDVLCVTFGIFKVVCFLSVGTDNSIRLTKKIKTSSEFYFICCMSPSHMVLSTDNDPRPARIISVDGVESDFNHWIYHMKTYIYGASMCTYVQSKNTLIMIERLSGKVMMYDTVKGTFREIINENIRGSCSACVGPGGTVLVLSTDNIVHLTFDGNQLGTYPVHMMSPNSMCVSKDGTKLAVSNSNTYTYPTKLQLYKISPTMG